MAKVFEKIRDIINPNRKQDRLRQEKEAAKRAEEQAYAMKMAAEEAERKRNEADKGK